MRAAFIVIVTLFVATASLAQERLVRLHAPTELIETGLFKYALPRFSLKTQVRVELVAEPGDAQIILGTTGRALFEGVGAVWHLQVIEPTPWSERLSDWLTSDVGQRTILGYAPEGTSLFSSPGKAQVEVAVMELAGDATLGLKVAKQKCARCHAVDEATRWGGIGSTPSFFVLRSFEDWQYRFSAFYVLKPHAAFTQVKNVTPPFPLDRPSPITPIEMTLDELEAVIAYAGELPAADLGAPIQHQ